MKDDYSRIAGDLLKQSRETKLDVDEKQHAQAYDYSAVDCRLDIQRALESAYQDGRLAGLKEAADEAAAEAERMARGEP